MGFFAIGAKNPSTFSIASCHFNFWCVPRRPLSCDYFCDIGLRLALPHVSGENRRADASNVSFSVYLPFETNPRSFVDLSSVVLNPKTAALIFGRPVHVDATNGTITYDGSSIGEGTITEKVVAIPREGAAIKLDKSGAWYSVWEIMLPADALHNQSLYTRFRFHVEGAGRTWIWKGWASGKRGALLDLRICDIRESLEVAEWDNVEKSIVPIQKLFCFVILPEQFLANTVSPEFHYLRLLEGLTWQDYVDAAGDHHRLRKLAIYQWRYPKSSSQVDVNNPFRIFMDITEEFGVRFLLLSFAAIVVGAFFGALAQDVVDKMGFWELMAGGMKSGALAVYAFAQKLGECVYQITQ